MKKVLNVLLISILVISLSACTTKKKDNNKEEPKKEEQKEEEVSLNKELANVEAFVIDNEDILGINKDGTSVPIIKGIMKNQKMHNIDYSDGALYVVEAETKMDYPTPNSRSKMLVVKKIWYDRIDLTQGDGNYKLEKIYEYENEDTGSTYLPTPNVYNNKMYIIKNAKEIISIDINTKELKVIENEIKKQVNNVIYGTYIHLDKNTGNLFYTGPIGDKVVLAKYDLKTNEKTIIETANNVVYHYHQFTKDGLIFNVQHYDGNYNTEVKKYSFNDNKVTLLTDKQQDSFYSCGNNYVTTKDMGPVTKGVDFGPHYMNIVMQDNNFKDIKNIFEKVNDESGIILWPYTYDKVEVSDGKKYYLFDCNNSELKEISNMYTQVAIKY